MPGKVKVKIVAGRNLPVMDRSNDTTDAYVEVKLGQITHKTDVCRKSLNPQWNSEWFRFEMDDLELQDEPLQIRLMDHDTYSANDAIGKVYLDLNPLLINTPKGKDSSGKMISGWIPVFDTMHGIRGEVNLMVKVELFSDLNKFRQSSCGVRFFFTQGVPEGYVAHAIQGFVEELVVNDDPEYQWIDKIRTPRASNEARQTLFSKLSGEVQRRVGLKALELGGNAVIGYKQCFDLEGESGIVVRGIGTAIFLTKLYDNQLSPTCGVLDPSGPSRESMEGQPLSKNRNQLSSRSLRKHRGGSPGRTARLRRSFRAPSSTHSMPDALPPPLRHQLQHVTDPEDEIMTISVAGLIGGGGSGVGGGDSIGKTSQESKLSFLEESSGFTRSRAGFSVKSLKMLGSSAGGSTVKSDSQYQKIIRRTTTTTKLKVPVPTMETVVQTEEDEIVILEPPHSAPAEALQLLDPFPSYLTCSSPSPLPPTFFLESAILNNSNNSNDDVAEPSSADTNRARNSNSMSSSESPKGVRSITNLSYRNTDDISRLCSQPVLDCNLVGESIDSNLEEIEDSTSDNSRMQSCEPTNYNQAGATDSDAGVQSPLPEKKSPEKYGNDQWTRKKSTNLDDLVSPTLSKKERFAILKKRRGSRKKDKFSTTCLIKRASEIFEDKEPGPSGKERIKEEFSKLLKRITSGETSADSDKVGKQVRKVKKERKSSPFREPSRFFFRNRQRTASGDSRRNRNASKLVRSTSESRSLCQTSLESLQSIESEPVFDMDEDDDGDLSDANCSSLIEIPTYSRAKISDDQSGNGSQVEQGVPVTMSKSQLRKLIKELGYDTSKSLKLYISSMDALLVYEPPLERQCSSSPSASAKPELMNVLSGACGVGAGSGDWNVVNLDSDSDLENLVHLSRTSTSSSRPLHHSRLRRHENVQTYQRGGTETSLSTNTDSSQSSFNHKDDRNTQPQQKRHYYHHHQQSSSREIRQGLLDFVKRNTRHERDFRHGSDDYVPNRSFVNTTTTTDDDDNSYDWTTPSSTFKCRDDETMNVLHDFGVMTGCRSPIPEELSETPVNAASWINKYSGGIHSSSPPLTSNLVLNNTPPNPSQHHLGSSISPASKALSNGVNHNNFTDGGKHNRDHRESSSNRSGSDSPEKIILVGGVLPVTTVASRIHHTTHSFSNNHGTVTNVTSHGAIIPLNRRSSESDLSTPPKGNSAFGPHNNRNQLPRTGINFENLEMLEFPFITISQFPLGFIFYLGGTVTARSVKLLERVSNLDEPETRDAWWNEIRMEIRSHCRAFGGTVVLGYEEHTTMCDDVCILSASGTAAVVVSGNLTAVDLLNISSKAGGRDISDMLKERNNASGRTDSLSSQPNVRQSYRMTKLLSANRRLIELADEDVMVQGLKAMAPKLRHDSDGSHDPACALLHIPHNGTPMPVSVRMTRCAFCKKGKVPDVLLATIEIPPGLHTTGRSCLIQAQVFRPKKDVRGETSAKEVSDSLPFLEYELHRRLINKLKVKGMNAIFGLQVQICLGDKMMVGIATGTAVFLTSLPPPNVPIISAGNLKTDSQKVVQFQKVVQEAFEKNREMFCVKNIVIPQTQNSNTSSDGDESDDELQDELGHRNKDTYVLEVDDAEDIDIISMLIDPSPPVGYNMNNIETLLGFDDHKVTNQQMFSQVWRCRVPSLSLRQFTAYFDRLIRSVTFKLRRMQPCVLTKLSFRIELPEQDEMQLSIIGMAVGIDKKNQGSVAESSSATSKSQPSGKGKAEDLEMIFPLDFDSIAVGALGSNDATINKISQSSGSGDKLTTSPNSQGPAAKPSSMVVKAPSPSSTPSVTVNPAGNGILTTNVSSSCISVSSSSSSSNNTNPPPTGSSQSDALNCTSGIPSATGILNQANSYSVRHPHSRGAKFLTSMGSHKLVPSPAPRMRYWVEITPLSYIHGGRIEKYLGNLNFFFIRETTSIRENGGLSGFVHNFITEVLAIVRAHVAALGGNAMVSYFMTECALLHNPHKNQGQCVVNVGGDAVFVAYPGGNPDDGHS